MASTPRNSSDADGLVQLLKPAQVARALGCSQWWVQEQARKRRIPFTLVGRAYRFTPEHVRQIIRIFEHVPGDNQPEPATGTTRRRTSAVEPVRPVVELKARPPRRPRRTARAER